MAVSSARDLFALPPEEFVAARDDLVAELTSSGDSEEAARVKKLRRPSVVAWGVNVASRERPKEVTRLLEAGDALRRAQRKTLSGGGGAELRKATDARRALIQALADAAVTSLGTRGASHRDAIIATLDAASVDEELGEQLRTGTLEREARRGAGFGTVEGFEVLAGGGADEEPGDGRAAGEDAAREARAAERRAATAERAAEKARRHADTLKEKATAAVSAAQEAEAEAKRLAQEARMERKRADRASREASK